MERAKPVRRSKNKPESAAETLDQLQSAGDRMAEWVGANSKPILIAAAVFLVAAAAYGFWETSRSESGEAASIALAEAQQGLRRDMGTGANELVVAEPANPATALEVRTRYLQRFQDVADRFPGTAQGAIAQGIGQALWEGMEYSPEGQPLTGSLMDYGLPTSMNMPEMELDTVETLSDLTPWGLKGIGELPTLAAPVAIANAVMAALSGLGIRHIDTPLTPEKIWQAMQDARK